MSVEADDRGVRPNMSSLEFRSEVFSSNGSPPPRVRILRPTKEVLEERLNYTLMSLVRSILAAMRLSKTLWDELIKTVAYLKNRSPGY